MNFTNYHQSVKFLESLLNLPIKDYLLDRTDRSFYIDRLNWLLKSLDSPHKNFKFIHIAGTAGKGTTVNTVHEILSSTGKQVGSFYSPHPTTAIERIKVNDKYIAPDEFAKLTSQLKPYLEKAVLKSPYGHPSYFETFLTLAFLYFKKQKCNYVVLEAGLGGTHDATNVINSPIITAITNINHDHLDVLGNNLTKIAKDKAGIIKKGSTFLTCETRPNILKIFKEQSNKLKVKMIKVESQDDPNESLADAIAKQLKLPENCIIKGIKKAKLPCRFETIQTKPLVIIDGSHNPAKMKFLAEKIESQSFDKLTLLMGMAEDKDIKKTLKHIIPLADELILTRFLMPYRKTADLKKMSELAKKIKPSLKTLIFFDPFKALNKGLKTTKPNDCLLITGSFFLAGELRTYWVPEEWILGKRRSF